MPIFHRLLGSIIELVVNVFGGIHFRLTTPYTPPTSGDGINFVHTTPYTPPTSYPTITELLLNIPSNTFDGDTLFYDDSGNNWPITSTVEHSTVQAHTGTSSILFNGTGHITLPDDEAFDFGAEDFCVEWWEYGASAGLDSSAFYVAHLWALGSGAGQGLIVGEHDNSGLLLWASSDGLTFDIASGVNMGTRPIGQWNHWAVTRDAGTWRTYCGGVKTQQFYNISPIHNPGSGWSPIIGKLVVEMDNSYIDDIKIWKGTSVYTGETT